MAWDKGIQKTMMEIGTGKIGRSEDLKPEGAGRYSTGIYIICKQ